MRIFVAKGDSIDFPKIDVAVKRWGFNGLIYLNDGFAAYRTEDLTPPQLVQLEKEILEIESYLTVRYDPLPAPP